LQFGQTADRQVYFQHGFILHNTMLVRYILSLCVCLSVRMSACLSITSRCSILKSLKVGSHKQHRTNGGTITDVIFLNNSRMRAVILKFPNAKAFAKFEWYHPSGDAKCRWSRL